MRKEGVLHPELCRTITAMGHTDTLVVADAGLPIPKGVVRIDLALVPGLPGFLHTVESILFLNGFLKPFFQMGRTY